MAAAPAIVPAAVLADFAATLQGMGFVTQADLQNAVAPLATQAQMALLQAQVAHTTQPRSCGAVPSQGGAQERNLLVLARRVDSCRARMRRHPLLDS